MQERKKENYWCESCGVYYLDNFQNMETPALSAQDHFNVRDKVFDVNFAGLAKGEGFVKFLQILLCADLDSMIRIKTPGYFYAFSHKGLACS